MVALIRDNLGPQNTEISCEGRGVWPARASSAALMRWTPPAT